MDIGKITQLAKAEFDAHVRCVYHQDLTGPDHQDHLKADDIGAGEFEWRDSNVAGSNPQHAYSPKGLLLSVERPIASGAMGSWGAADVKTINLPAAFLLVGVFNRPAKIPPNATGTFAPSLLMNTDLTPNPLIGATCQFKPEGPRLNVPGENLQRTPIAADLQAQIVDAQHPSALCLAFKVDRSAAPVAAKAWLFVGNSIGDSVTFTSSKLKTSTPIFDVRAGIGTADGIDYRASVYLLRFQIWAPAV